MPLTIGIIVPFTESAINSDFGVAQQRAAELYLQQKAGMLAGRPAKFVYSDESISAALDMVKATQLVETEHADVLLGLISTDGAYTVRSYADEKHVLFIDTNASGNSLTRTLPGCTPSCQSPYLFRTSYSAWQLAEPLGVWAAGSGLKDFDVVARDDTFGAESAAAFLEGLGKAGGTATAQVTVKLGASWSTVVAAVGAQATKNVFAAFAGSDAVAFLTAWDEAGLKARGYRLYGPGPLADADVLAAVKGAAAGVTTASFWASSLDNPENAALENLFSRAYSDENGNPIPADSYVVEMWDAMTALDRALSASSGSTDVNVLVSALGAVSFNSPRGPFVFDPATHNVIQNIYIREIGATGVSAANVVVATIPAVADPGR